MKTIVHRAEDRGSANHGWLEAKHSFSFAQWYNPEKIHFGALRVLNDDTIAPGMGFGTHPHDNMEIITIPLEGGIRHRDSMGHEEVIEAGEVQVMSAGSGITHSEFNASKSEYLRLFQIWIIPNQTNVTPRYDQRHIDVSQMNNAFLTLVGPEQNDNALWVHQNAWIHMAELDANNSIEYTLKDPNNGLYTMIVNGLVEVGENVLKNRDAIGITDTEKVTFFAKEKSKLLVLEVPMNW